MDSEDDICVLQQSPDDEVDICPHPIIPFSPISNSSPFAFDRGSHHALQKAYAEVKRRLNESDARNQQLLKKIQKLESSRYSEIGDSYDMMDDVSGGSGSSQGAAEVQMAAEEGFNNNLQRQLARAKTQLQVLDTKYQEDMKTMEMKLNLLSQQLQETQTRVTQLLQENLTLQQNYEAIRTEKDLALQSLQHLQEKCCSLETERDKFMKEGSSLQHSLQKASQEVAVLKEKQADSLLNESSPELVNELASMHRIIDSLKKMVLLQREFLASRGLSLSVQSNRFLRGPSCVDSETLPLGSNRSGGSHSGHSWELVNGVASSSQDSQPPLKQQQKLAMAEPASVSPPSSKVGLIDTTASVARSQAVNGLEDVGSVVTAQGQLGSAFQGPKAKTEIIQRIKSEDVAQSRSKSEMIRANTIDRSTRLAGWMDSHCQQQLDGLNQFHQDASGLNQRNGIVERVHELDQPRPPEHLGLSYTTATYPCQSHIAPLSTYDNLTFGNNNAVPSMHILNKSGLAGARVVQTSADNFGNSGGRTRTLSSQQIGQAIAINRDCAVARGSPQEHTDLMQTYNPTHLELNNCQQIHFENESPGDQKGAVLDKKCPVCGQDCSQLSMDEFQTHVFECFDDDEDANAPETLLPQQVPKSKSLGKECPMCCKQFPDGVSQQFFEGHVQSHFEETVDHFEVLDVNRC